MKRVEYFLKTYRGEKEEKSSNITERIYHEYIVQFTTDNDKEKYCDIACGLLEKEIGNDFELVDWGVLSEEETEKNFIVHLTKVFNGTYTIKAESEEDAVHKVEELLANNPDLINWNLGEVTADFAEEDEF